VRGTQIIGIDLREVVVSPSVEAGWPQKSLGITILFVAWGEPNDLKKSLKILLFCD